MEEKMRTRNITEKEAHELGKVVFVHLADEETGGDKDYPTTIDGYRNDVEDGLQVSLIVEGQRLWFPVHRVFVEDKS